MHVTNHNSSDSKANTPVDHLVDIAIIDATSAGANWPMKNSRVQDKFVIRLPDGLRPELAAVASRNQRSMNGEIIHRLEGSLNLELVLNQKNEVIAQLLNRIHELEARL